MSHRNPTQHEIDVYCGEWILNGGDQSKAWRVAYPTSKMIDTNIHARACEMHKLTKVRERLAELQAETAEKDQEAFDISFEAQVKRCLAIHESGMDASEKQNLSAAQGAVNEINKMAGHHAATVTETVNHTLGAKDRKERIVKLMEKLGK